MRRAGSRLGAALRGVIAGVIAVASAAGVTAATAATGGQTVLERYLSDLHTLRAEFTQTVTDPHGKVVESGAGSLVVERPGKFRWDYEPRAAVGAAQGADERAHGAGDASQSGQLLIGDGRNLWFYDRELAQVTVKPLSAGLSATPIMLLSGALTDLRAAFEVMDAGAHEGLQWVAVRPRDPQAGFSEARLGFRGEQLARMIVHDMLGQTVQLDFSHSQRNVPVNAAAFEFSAPPGVDVIGTPQS